MSNTANRVLVALGIAAVFALAAFFEKIGWHGVLWLSILVVAADGLPVRFNVKVIK